MQNPMHSPNVTKHNKNTLFKINFRKSIIPDPKDQGSLGSLNLDSKQQSTQRDKQSPPSSKRQNLSAKDGIELLQSKKLIRDQEFTNHLKRLETITFNSLDQIESQENLCDQDDIQQTQTQTQRYDNQNQQSSSDQNQHLYFSKLLNSVNYTDSLYRTTTIEDIQNIKHIPSHKSFKNKSFTHQSLALESISQIDKSKGFIPKYFYSLETSISQGYQVLQNGEIQWQELEFINVLLALVQEFTTSNFFVIPFAFYQGGFMYSNIFLLASFFLTAYPMIALVNLKRLTNLTLRELCFVKWGYLGKSFADICVFFTHFSDLYQYIQGLSLMVTKFAIFLDFTITPQQSFWIQLILFFPLVCFPQFTNKMMLRYICDFFMAVGLFVAIFLDYELISEQEVINYNYWKSVNVIQSAMNMFSCFEESISVYEIYRDKFTDKQTIIFKKYIWISHFCIYLISLVFCNLTWFAFQDKTKQNVMDMYDDHSWIVFVSKIFFILAAVPAYGHLFAPLDIISKDFYGITSENNKMAYWRLKKLNIDHLQFPKQQMMEGTNWFKLCYFHHLAVQDEMEKLNKDNISVSQNKKLLFYITKFLVVFFSIKFGMMTSEFSNAIFNVFQIFFKTPISLILPCILYLSFGNLSITEMWINRFIVVIGIILSCTSFLFLSI